MSELREVYRFLQLKDGNVILDDPESPLLVETVVSGVPEVRHPRREFKSFPLGHVMFA